MRIRAISLDLDDTLWPIAPVMRRVESHLHEWLSAQCPEVAQAWPIEAMRTLRDQVAREHPELAHDFTAQRRLTLARAFAPFGYGEDWVDAAYAIYLRERNRVDCYADAIPVLTTLAARMPLVSISNGNADLASIGLQQHFHFSVSARELGIAKPAADIFLHACERLGLPPESVLHVGDDPLLDVAGARAAGLRTAWLNRGGTESNDAAGADLVIGDLHALVDWLDAREMPLPPS